MIYVFVTVCLLVGGLIAWDDYRSLQRKARRALADGFARDTQARPAPDSLGVFVLHVDELPTVPPPGKADSAITRMRDRENADTAPDYLRWSIPCEPEYAERLPAPPLLPVILPPPWHKSAA